MRYKFTISDDNKKFLEQAKAKMNIKTTSELLNKIIFLSLKFEVQSLKFKDNASSTIV